MIPPPSGGEGFFFVFCVDEALSEASGGTSENVLALARGFPSEEVLLSKKSIYVHLHMHMYAERSFTLNGGKHEIERSIVLSATRV